MEIALNPQILDPDRHGDQGDQQQAGGSDPHLYKIATRSGPTRWLSNRPHAVAIAR
ncbi:hypothetical protein [Streptomyces sp. NPDC057939]|uniref:hypothetical protein n=1 Tax=Streptomyces sp. NPDC057939 TaxID=3346284 RepID=UPI0036EF86DB